MDPDDRVVEEDRLSSLPYEIIHKILSSFDMQFVVQTCLLLSSRWKLLWTSMPCLNFSYKPLYQSPKYVKFVTQVLSHRSHEKAVTSVNLNFSGSLDHDFEEKIANYAFSHNVQQLTVSNLSVRHLADYPPCLYSCSQSLKHFTLTSNDTAHCITFKTPLDFPALTTLHLENIGLQSDIFSKCVNLKDLTLYDFWLKDVEVYDIITPRLSNLKLIDGYVGKTINVIAPQLENLTITDCSIDYLNAPPGLSSLVYNFNVKHCHLLQFSNDRFHSLNKVTITLSNYDLYDRTVLYKEEDAHKIINMLPQLRSARYLTLNTDFVECISSFPDMLSNRPSPFSNLNCLTIESYSVMNDAHKVQLCTEARNFLLENSPNAILKLPEVPSRI